MRPSAWIDIGAAKLAAEQHRKWWKGLSEEERAQECGMTLAAYRKMCVAGRALGRACGESLNRSTELILKGQGRK